MGKGEKERKETKKGFISSHLPHGQLKLRPTEKPGDAVNTEHTVKTLKRKITFEFRSESRGQMGKALRASATDIFYSFYIHHYIAL